MAHFVLENSQRWKTPKKKHDTLFHNILKCLFLGSQSS
jgi:hypothetical protein